MSATRKQISDALFALGSAATWGSPTTGFTYTSKRLMSFADCADQPAFFQVMHDEHFAQVTGMPYKVRLTAKWVIYYNVAVDPTVVGSDLGDEIMDALQATLVPRIVPGQPYYDRCTLGGLAYHAFISGQVFRDGGDLDGQGVMVVPIDILVP